jgi:hypothetical protein
MFSQEVTCMDAETYRRKAEQYFTFARQMIEPNAKAALIDTQRRIGCRWLSKTSLDHREQIVEANRTQACLRRK